MKTRLLLFLTILLCSSESGFSQTEPAKPEISKPEKAEKAEETGAEGYKEQVSSAPRLLADLQKKLDEPPAPFDKAAWSALPIEKIDAERTATEVALAGARAETETLASKDTERTARLARLPTEIAELRAKLDEFDETKTADKQTISELKAKLDTLEWEQKSYTATASLFGARQEMSRRHVTLLERKLKALQKIFDIKHAEETDRAVEDAEAVAARYSSVPVVAKLADVNAELAKERQDVGKSAADAQKAALKFLKTLKEIQSQRSTAQDRITLLESAGLKIDTETGKLLRLQRHELPAAAELKLELQEVIKASASAQIKLLEIRRALTELPLDPAAEAKRLAAEVKSEAVTDTEIQDLLSQRQTTLRDLTKDYTLLIDALNKVSAAIRKVGTEQAIYSQYLDERLLWIPSAERLHRGDLEVEIRGIKRLFSEDFFGLWLQNLTSSIRYNLLPWIISSTLIIYLVLKRKQLRRQLRDDAELAKKKTTTSITPTFRAFAVTLLLALPIPLVFGLLAWQVPEPPNISYALAVCASFYFVLGVFLRMTAKNGFLRYHVKMEGHRVNRLHWHLRWYFTFIPFVLFFFLALPGTDIGPRSGGCFSSSCFYSSSRSSTVFSARQKT